MHLLRMRRRPLWIAIFLFSLFALWISLQLDQVENILPQPAIIACELNDQRSSETTKFIFDLAAWRNLLAADQLAARKHQLTWCAVPAELKIIAEAICRFYSHPNCTHLPCQMIYSSPSTLTDMNCLTDGRVVANQRKCGMNCKRGISLDLFIQDVTNASSSSFPSILADPYSPIDNDLYINVLHRRYRSRSSMWGVIFNFESLSYYPWTGDPQKMKLFDATFGYDRSVYDFTPDPWLFNYIGEISAKTKRMSREEVMHRKKAIRSLMPEDVYWPKETTNADGDKNSAAPSYLQAPILWMNSNCKPKFSRTQYMRELMRHIPVDNFGTCGPHIRSPPEHIVRIQGSANHSLKNLDGYNWSAGKQAMSSDYLFTIAIENSIAHDYITEKLWQPLVVGSVPIYLGAPNVDDWLPCRTPCIIDLRQFKSPHDAAKHIDRVAKNRTLYESYHRWRDEPLREQFEKMLKYFEKMREYSAECVLCDMSRRVDEGEDAKEMKRKIKESLGGF